MSSICSKYIIRVRIYTNQPTNNTATRTSTHAHYQNNNEYTESKTNSINPWDKFHSVFRRYLENICLGNIIQDIKQENYKVFRFKSPQKCLYANNSTAFINDPFIYIL